MTKGRLEKTVARELMALTDYTYCQALDIVRKHPTTEASELAKLYPGQSATRPRPRGRATTDDPSTSGQ